MSAVSSLAGPGAEPQPKSNFVHFNFKICRLVADYAVSLQYAVKKFWYGKNDYFVLPIPQLVYSYSLPDILFHYVSAPLGISV